MKSIKELIHESVALKLRELNTLKLSKEPIVKSTNSYTEITWLDLGVEFKKIISKNIG